MAGHLRRPADVLLRPRPVERRGPDPQGADVRPRRRRRQPRRGRQGVLVVPGLHAHPLVDALALPLPAGRLPVRRAGRGQRRARPRRDRVRAGRHRHLRRRPVLGGDRRLRQGRPDRPVHAGHRRPTGGRSRRPCTCCRRCGSATPGRGGCPAATRCRSITGAARATQRRRLLADHRVLGPAGAGRRAATPAAAVLRQRDQRRAAVGAARAARRTRRTASTTTWCTAPTRSTRTGRGTKAALHYVLDGAGRRAAADPAAADPASADGVGARRRRRPRRRLRRGDVRPGAPRRTSSSPTCIPRGHAPTRRWRWSGRPSPG